MSIDSATMLAARYTPGLSTLVIERIPRPSPGRGEVLIRVHACGACRSDVFMLNGGGAAAMDWKEPFVMGHEACGEAVELGEGADVELGAIFCVHVTSAQPPAPRGSANFSTMIDRFGNGINGAFAQYVAVPESALVRVPVGIPSAIAAVLADAGTTAYAASAYVRAGDRVLVIGVGGVGLFGVQLAVLRGAGPVIASDSRASARALALRAGASCAFAPEELAAAVEAREINVDVVIDFVSTPATFKTAREALRAPFGPANTRPRLVIVGVGHGDVTVNLGELIFTPFEIIPSVYGSKDDLAQVLQLVNEKRLTVEVEQFPLKDVNLVLEGLRNGIIRSRAVLIPPEIS